MAEENAAFAQAHRQLIADRSIQFDFPAYVPPELPDWLKWLGKLFEALAPAMPYLFWGAVIIGGAIILFLIVREVIGARWRWPWRRKLAVQEDDNGWRPDATAARALLEEADALAREERYAEAAHLLLWRSVEDIALRRPDVVKPALTARDIAAAPDLPAAARTTFAGIARTVEVSLFGSASVDAGQWRDCRSAYERFALPEAWA